MGQLSSGLFSHGHRFTMFGRKGQLACGCSVRSLMKTTKTGEVSLIKWFNYHCLLLVVVFKYPVQP